ncbi:MAG: crossover junction endodeoxyribonuclease RuvC [Bacillota bacterium]
MIMVGVGVDPGLARTGYGVIRANGSSVEFRDCGCIETPGSSNVGARLRELYTRFTQLLQAYRPDYLAIEKLFFCKNVSSAIEVAQARGVVLLAAAIEGVPVIELGPRQAKQIVTGYGSADKKQVQKMVAMVLGLNQVPQPDDSADALALALAGAVLRQNQATFPLQDGSDPD